MLTQLGCLGKTFSNKYTDKLSFSLKYYEREVQNLTMELSEGLM